MIIYTFVYISEAASTQQKMLAGDFISREGKIDPVLWVHNSSQHTFSECALLKEYFCLLCKTFFHSILLLFSPLTLILQLPRQGFLFNLLLFFESVEVTCFCCYSVFLAPPAKKMASGTSSPAAEEVLRTTKEKENFQRLTRLLMRGGLALLREVFDSIHPLGSLSAVLRANKEHLKNLTTPNGHKVFSYAERKCLYDPHGPGTYGKSAEFDISLLYKLLRSICSLPAPVTGWDMLPNSTDHSREADIARIRYYRNEIYSHDRLMQVPDDDFGKLWMDISEALLRIAEGISSAKREDWKKAIEKFLRAPLTPDAEECVDELQFWYLTDMETKHTLDQMQLKLAEMQKQLEQLKSKLDIFIAVIQQEPITSSNSVLEVEGAQSPSESVETRISIPQEQPSAEGAAGQSTSTELPASQQNNTEVQNFWDDVSSSNRSLNRLKKYLKKKFGANVLGDRRGSLIITVSCSSLEVLEELWKEYRTGHLNEVIQATLVTAEVLEKLNLKEVKLRTIISEEDYLSYKEFLNKSAGNAVKRN